MVKTTSVTITFGFDKNKFGNPRIYRKGRGKNLAEAIQNLTRQRGNNFLPEEQREEIAYQFRTAAKNLS